MSREAESFMTKNCTAEAQTRTAKKAGNADTTRHLCGQVSVIASFSIKLSFRNYVKTAKLLWFEHARSDTTHVGCGYDVCEGMTNVNCHYG